MSHTLVKLCVDAAKGKIPTNYTADQASDAIRQEFIELMGTDKPDFRKLRSNQNEIFAIIEEVLDRLITDGVTSTPFFDQFVDYKDVALGDANEFYVEDRSVLAIAEVAGGHYDLRRQKLNIGDSFSVKTKWYGASVYGDFFRFITGRLDWAGLVRKIDEAMRLKIAADIYAAFMGATAYLPSEFKKTGSFTDLNISDLIQRVQTANGYAPVVIAGTRNALKKINGVYSASSFLLSDGMKEQLNSKGIVNVYEGIPLMEIPQVFTPNTFDFALDDSKLLVLPANTKPIKFVREGQSYIKETTDNQTNMDMSMEYTFLTMYGIAVQFSNAYGVYTLS